MPNNRNIILIIVGVLLLIAYEQFIIAPVEKRHDAEAARAQAVAAAQQKTGLAPNGQPIVPVLSRSQALAVSPRVAVETPDLSGSISLAGARLDDLFLKQYRQTTDKNAPMVELLSPLGAKGSYLAFNGWTGANLAGLPDGTTVWSQVSQGPLTNTHPLELSYAAPNGLVFHREIKVDEGYLFTVTDQVQNTGTTSAEITPFGRVARSDLPPNAGKLAMEGAIGMFNSVLKEFKYADWKKKGDQDFTSTGGWVGLTDKYWMTAFVPNQTEALQGKFQVLPGQASDAAGDTYEAQYEGAARTIAPGGTTTETTHLFAGAKVFKTLTAYGQTLGTPRFADAIDWGIFSIINKPLFGFLEFLKGQLGSFALALLALTVVIRVTFFPLYNASFSMSIKMKKVQPQLKALQEKYKTEPAELQKEMMALYGREKINPVTGCIPALLPFPVLISLTQLFNVTIEMRQTPFFNWTWIKDMSAPDPTTIWNLFGVIPWNPAALPLIGGFLTGDGLLHIGALPLLYAGTFWLITSIAPPTPGMDPTQQRLMQFMPLITLFFFVHSPAGLMLYWTWSSCFTIVQQYVLMRRFKVENPIDSFFSRLFAPKAATG